MQTVSIFLFPVFETLDVFGPAEIFGRRKEEYKVQLMSMDGGLIESAHGFKCESISSSTLSSVDILLIPGGMGTRQCVNDDRLIGEIRRLAELAPDVLTVCTGTSLLARTGLLDGQKATSNKIAFDWVMSQGPAVDWQRQARWIVSGKFYTSSGVTAGMDMSLAFMAEKHGLPLAEQTAREIEYIWNRNSENDPFA